MRKNLAKNDLTNSIKVSIFALTKQKEFFSMFNN